MSSYLRDQSNNTILTTTLGENLVWEIGGQDDRIVGLVQMEWVILLPIAVGIILALSNGSSL